MIQVDPRAGSRDLIPVLRARGLPVEESRMEYGDVAFVGVGEGGVPVTLGIEVKTLDDVIKVIQDGRFSGKQLPGLLDSYQIPFLLVIGQYKEGKGGELLVPGKKGWEMYGGDDPRRRVWLHRALTAWMMTMAFRAGVIVWHEPDLAAAAAWIHVLYRWWEEGFDTHKAHLNRHRHYGNPRGGVRLTPITFTQKVAQELPGFGPEKEKAVTTAFPSVARMVFAAPEEWTNIPGVGPTLAKKAHDALWGK